jgi:hypothetical protein
MNNFVNVKSPTPSHAVVENNSDTKEENRFKTNTINCSPIRHIRSTSSSSLPSGNFRYSTPARVHPPPAPPAPPTAAAAKVTTTKTFSPIRDIPFSYHTLPIRNSNFREQFYTSTIHKSPVVKDEEKVSLRRKRCVYIYVSTKISLILEIFFFFCS